MLVSHVLYKFTTGFYLFNMIHRFLECKGALRRHDICSRLLPIRSDATISIVSCESNYRIV